MIKKIVISLFVLATMVMACVAEQAPIVIVNTTLKQLEDIEITPDDHVMVWIRDLERLGWGSISNTSNGETLFSNPKVTLAFNKNSDSAKFNSLSVKLPVKTYLKDGKMMVPISFVAKTMGYEYSAEERVIVFIKQPDVPEENNSRNDAPAIPTNPKPTETPKANDPTPVPKVPPANKSDSNWFQGTVVHNDKKISGVKLALTDSNNKFVKTAVSDTNGIFAFYNLPNGNYNVVINNVDNPLYKTDKIGGLSVSGGVAKKLDKPIQLMGAMKLKTIPKLDSKKNYNLTWNNIPGASQYKITLSSPNAKALKPNFTTKNENLSIPVDKLSKGQNYNLKAVAINSKGAIIGESNGKEWAISTP